jgi:hypothetical protein
VDNEETKTAGASDKGLRGFSWVQNGAMAFWGRQAYPESPKALGIGGPLLMIAIGKTSRFYPTFPILQQVFVRFVLCAHDPFAGAAERY